MYKICNQTLFIGKKVFVLKKYSSSNAFLKKLLRQSNLCEGTTIHIINQTNGVGQRGNQWESQSNKNITCSLLLRPIFLPLTSQFLLNIAISLAVRQCIAQYIPNKVKIKWPNDIYVEKQKIAGILIENIISHKSINATVVGIGINTNQTRFESTMAVSIFNIIQSKVDNEQITCKLYQLLEYYYTLLRQKEHSILWQEYYKHLLGYKTQQLFTVAGEDPKPFLGEIIEISERGMLIIKVGKEVQKYNFQEVRMIMD